MKTFIDNVQAVILRRKHEKENEAWLRVLIPTKLDQLLEENINISKKLLAEDATLDLAFQAVLRKSIDTFERTRALYTELRKNNIIID